MNQFLASLEITFRRDPTNYRPRVNKLNSVKDKEQKGKYLLARISMSVLILLSQRQLLFLGGVDCSDSSLVLEHAEKILKLHIKPVYGWTCSQER